MISWLSGSRRPTPFLARLAREVVRLRPASTSLDVVRLVHLAQVVHVGTAGTPFGVPFRASAMGPMNQDLLGHAKAAVAIARRGRIDPQDLDPAVAASLAQICVALRDATSGEIVATVHRDGGAWARRYTPCPSATMPLSDPRRHTMPRQSAYDGALITGEDMMAEVQLFA